MAMKIKKASRGQAKGKILKAGKSLEKKRTLDGISLNYTKAGMTYTTQ
jgi:hypothetical protein